MSGRKGLGRAGATVGRPVVDYFNEQFEAVKEEIRLQVGEQHARRTDEQLDGLRSELVAAIDALAARTGDLQAAVDELRVTNDQILAVIAAGVGVDDDVEPSEVERVPDGDVPAS